MPTPRPAALAVALALGLGPSLPWLAPAARADPPLPAPPVLQRWIEDFVASPRGPFEGIRWFCADGSVRPADAGCADRGGGVQHGAWGPRARTLRAHGYQIANLLVALDPDDFVGPDADLEAWKQVLLERFLVDAHEGWIYRRAFGYRGAFQVEDEQAAARRLVAALLLDPRWREDRRFLLLRESVRLLPVVTDTASAAEVRATATRLAARDPRFEPLRAKLHGFPDADDARRVREYAAERGRPELAAAYETLADQLDALYAPSGAAVRALLPHLEGRWERMHEQSHELETRGDPARRFRAAAFLLRRLREALPRIEHPAYAFEALRIGIALERDAYAAGAELAARGGGSRRERLAQLAVAAEALYGTGLLEAEDLAQIEAAVARASGRRPRLRHYRDELRLLARVPEWSARRLAFHFGETTERWSAIEPRAALYTADRLRGSPMLAYGRTLDVLLADANRLAGVEHQLLGTRVDRGLRALNPGLARGVLRRADRGATADLRPDGIYLLPETVADLPPVAGILTRGEGSALSHVQLLARDLGIPNVRIDDALAADLEAHLGEQVVLAVSPGGVVRLTRDDGRWDDAFGPERDGPEMPADESATPLVPDLEKLDLEASEPWPLDALRARDAGRVAGPKGANLGELRHAFGDAVPDGFVIPFGAFRRLMDAPIASGGPSAFEWLAARGDRIQATRDPARRDRLVRDTLAELRRWLARAPLPEGFEEALRRQLEELGPGGVFVRSDTNVEDLPGFSGAGLNRTVPNVVGADAVLAAVREVWASAFTERAWAWRQARMADPEWVLPAVLVQRAFASEVSGVLATVDVETGDPHWLTIAANEGVGGAVAGQAAETLLVAAGDADEVRLLAPAAAPRRTVLAPGGGVATEPASGAPRVLGAREIEQLVKLARRVPDELPWLRDSETGIDTPVDIEFAFRDGRLALLQIRPLGDTAPGRRHRALAALDAPLHARDHQRVATGDPPLAAPTSHLEARR